MTTLAKQLLTNEARLIQACGDPIPTFTEAILSQVEQAMKNAGDAASDSTLPGWAAGLSPLLLPSLASAHRHRREPRFARAARGIYEHWLVQEPLADGRWNPPPKYDVLLIPHRLGDTECIGWFGSLPSFLDSPDFDEAFLQRLIDSARGQLNYLAEHVHEGRNIRVSQGDGLFTQGLRLSFLPDSQRWRDVGLRVMNDAFNRMISDDGSSVEATGWYHYIVMNMAYRYWQLKQALPEFDIQITPRQVAAMFDYTLAVVEPAGVFNRIGDCTARITAGCTLQTMLDRRAAARRAMGLPEQALPTSQLFPNAGQVMLRDNWTAQSSYLTFDATRRVGYHWHPSLNAVQLHLNGQRVIADPGRMTYQRTPQRFYALSTAGHSTANLNGLNQDSIAPHLSHCRVEEYDVIASQYQGGYWTYGGHGHGRGLFGEHHRTVVWVRGRFFVIIDNIYHEQLEGQKPRVECNWQFAPGVVKIEEDPQRVLTEHGGQKMLMLPALLPEGMRLSLHQGELEDGVCRGWIANLGDQPTPAPLLRMSVEDFDPWNADLATVLIPYVGDAPPRVSVEGLCDPADTINGRFVLRWPDGGSDEFRWTRRLAFALDECEGFTTDAALVHLRKDAGGRLLQALIFEGSYLNPYTSTIQPKAQTFVFRP